MLTMHPTLLVGPADWDPVRMPKEEFRARIDAMWRQDPAAGGAIVHGDSRDHADLAYLTNFTPKLAPALALIPRAGEPQLLVGGGANMVPAAKPLTWIDRLLPLRDAGNTVAAWARALPGGNRLLLIGGDGMRHAMHRDIIGALAPDVVLTPTDARLALQAPCMSAREIAAIRDSCATLDAATVALTEARRSGVGTTAALLAAEHAAWRAGAQDVRTLFSINGGGRLQPFALPVERTADPFQVYIAVRRLGYWAEGFVMLADRPHPPLECVRAVRRQALAGVGPGVSRGDLSDAVTKGVKPHKCHPVSAGMESAVHIGLSLDDAGRDDLLAPGDVLSLRVGVAGDEGAAIVSAMIAITDSGNEVLWS